jgi:hypothetical protein
MQTGLWTVYSALEEDPRGRGRHGLAVDKYSADTIRLTVNPALGVEDVGYCRLNGSALQPIPGRVPEFDLEAAHVEIKPDGIACLTDGKNIYLFKNQPAEQLEDALGLIKQRVGEMLAKDKPGTRIRLEAPSRHPA